MQNHWKGKQRMRQEGGLCFSTQHCTYGESRKREGGQGCQVLCVYRLTVCVLPGIEIGVGRNSEHGPSRHQTESLTPRNPAFGIVLGHIVTQIVRLVAYPFITENTRIGSRFVSPSQ